MLCANSLPKEFGIRHMNWRPVVKGEKSLTQHFSEQVGAQGWAGRC